MREDMTRAEMVEKCRRDRDKLTDKMMALYPEFEGQMPSAWIEDLIPSLCGFRVDTFPLPKGQLGICDVGNRLILTNSQMATFVGSGVCLERLRKATLGHELGHSRLHVDEFDQFISLHDRWQKTSDPRFLQRESEADLYAAVFLVPGSLLLANPKGQELYLAWRGNREIKSGRLKYLISALAIDFGVTYTLMRRSLEERGWLCCYWETKTLALSPRKATE